MSIFSTACIQRVFISVIIVQIVMTQVESTFPSSAAAKVRRTQSMKASSYNSELRPKTRPVSPSTSSTSSTASRIAETEPMASTSALLQEIDIKPIVEESKRVRFGSATSLVDPMAVTHSENLDPARDGVFARMRNAMVRYGSAAAIGSALGAGVLAAKQLLSQNNTMQSVVVNTTTQNLSNQTDYDGIDNPFN